MVKQMSTYCKIIICNDMAAIKLGIFEPYLENYERQQHKIKLQKCKMFFILCEMMPCM